MAEALPLSAFIISFNEGARIGATLASVNGLAQEILVVDSGSTDGTQAIAEQFGAKVIHHDWQGYGYQKRFAEDQCRHDWVLNLDADEVLSEALIKEIRQAFAAELHAKTDGYEFKIRDCVPGEAKPRAFAHMTRAVRLYRKSQGRFAESAVHDRVQFSKARPRIRVLAQSVWHYSAVSVEQVIAKLNRYSTLQVEDMKTRGRFPKHLLLRLYTELPLAFLKSYLFRLDVLRGNAGFVNAVTYAFSRFARLAKAREARNKK